MAKSDFGVPNRPSHCGYKSLITQLNCNPRFEHPRAKDIATRLLTSQKMSYLTIRLWKYYLSLWSVSAFKVYIRQYSVFLDRRVSRERHSNRQSNICNTGFKLFIESFIQFLIYLLLEYPFSKLSLLYNEWTINRITKLNMYLISFILVWKFNKKYFKIYKYKTYIININTRWAPYHVMLRVRHKIELITYIK